MPSKTRIITVSILILLGGALFCYCAVYYPKENATQAEDASTAVTASKAAPVQATSACDAAQDKSKQASQNRAPRTTSNPVRNREG